MLKGSHSLDKETFSGAMHAAVIIEKTFASYLCEVRKALKSFWLPLFVTVHTVEYLMTVAALLLPF